jgi:hypothetical protein
MHRTDSVRHEATVESQAVVADWVRSQAACLLARLVRLVRLAQLDGEAFRSNLALGEVRDEEMLSQAGREQRRRSLSPQARDQRHLQRWEFRHKSRKAIV